MYDILQRDFIATGLVRNKSMLDGKASFLTAALPAPLTRLLQWDGGDSHARTARCLQLLTDHPVSASNVYKDHIVSGAGGFISSDGF